MALCKFVGPEIRGVVNVVPHHTEDNLELELLAPEERHALVAHTGIRFRKIAPRHHSVQHYFEKAVETLLHKTSWNASEIDVFICVTQSPEMVIPAVSCRIHGNLNMGKQTLCFDINSGCSGFVYGLNTVYALLSGLGKKNGKAILCCGDLSTHLIEPNDKSVRPIFSDGVAAVAIENRVDEASNASFFNLETDGSGQHAIEMQTTFKNENFMRLNGIDVFNYSVRSVPQNITDLFQFAGNSPETVDLFVFHQANKLINESIRKKLNVPAEKVPYSLYDYGNTASASIPMTIATDWKRDSMNSGWLLLSGFGVGFSIGSALVHFNPLSCDGPIEF